MSAWAKPGVRCVCVEGDFNSECEPGFEAAPHPAPAGEVPAIKNATDALVKAGDALSFAAQTTGGTAGRDEGLVSAIGGWAKAKGALKAIRRIVRYEGAPATAAPSPDVVEALDMQALVRELVLECERAMRQRDEALADPSKRGSDGRTHDTGFEFIVRKHLQAALSSGSKAPEGWQPIETAPKPVRTEAVRVLAAFPEIDGYWRVDAVYWTGGRNPYWTSSIMEDVHGARWMRGHQPTHWRPLPAPPALAATPPEGETK